MNVVFRVDAALHIGSGHVMRCLTLANELKHRDAHCVFICREFEGNLISLIKEKGFAVYSLPYTESLPTPTGEQIVPHEHWLGVPYLYDAQQTIDIFKTLTDDIDWVIIDHYAIDIRWEELIRPYIKKMMLIDDLADRRHNCDLLLDQNYFDNFLHRYDSLVPFETKRLLGPRYVLLKQSFKAQREKANHQKRDKKQILVFFGGVDKTGETLKLIKGIKTIIGYHVLHIVVGKANPYFSEILDELKDIDNIKLYSYVENMAELMGAMDYSFGACGTTNWERMCVGLNCGIVSVAENQIEISHFLGEEKLIDYIGHCDEVTELDYNEFFLKLDLESNELCERKKVIMKMVDGLGANRVLTNLIGE